MIDNILIDYYPQQKALSEIEKWLCEDNEESVKGFYNNIPTIKKCFLEGKLITLTLNDETIGFLTWSEGEKYIEIDIFEIHKNFRKRGFGEFFIDKVGRKFASQGFIAFKLFCEPSESEMFWKKLKFTKFQNRETLPDLSYFKPIIKSSVPNVCVDPNNKIELWDKEPYQIKTEKARWTFYLPNQSKLPIIFECDGDWLIRITKNAKIIHQGKVKRINSEKFKIAYYPFLFMQNVD